MFEDNVKTAFERERDLNNIYNECKKNPIKRKVSEDRIMK